MLTLLTPRVQPVEEPDNRSEQRDAAYDNEIAGYVAVHVLLLFASHMLNAINSTQSAVPPKARADENTGPPIA